jgi:hypothetical protein
MGQQQLLLIILGVIIVGIAVAVAVTMFSDNSVTANRDAMATDMLHLAAKARHYYGRPSSMGGGSRSFVGVTMDKLVTTNFANNANGSYVIIGTPDADSVVFRGTGKAVLPDGVSNPVVEMAVYASGPQPIRVVQ